MGAARLGEVGVRPKGLYRVGLLGLLLSNAFVTFITPRMSPEGMVAAG